MKRPWLVRDAEGAGRYAVAIIRKPAKKWRDTDADLAGSCARWAWHWACLAVGA